MGRNDRAVVITQEVIDRAVPRDSGGCVIVEAIEEAHPEYSHVFADLATIRWSVAGKRYTVLTTPKAQQILLAFDQGDKIEPTTLYLGPPIQIREIKRVKVISEGKTLYRNASRKVQGTKPSSGTRSTEVVIGGCPLPSASLKHQSGGSTHRVGGLKSHPL